MSYGLALIQKGKSAEGIGTLKAGMAFWDASGGKNFTPPLASRSRSRQRRGHNRPDPLPLRGVL
jgi:hypothetical protein